MRSQKGWVGGAPRAWPESTKPSKLAQVVPRDSSHTTCSIFPALPKAAQFCWLKTKLPPKLLPGQRLAGCVVTLLLRPARLGPTRPFQVALIESIHCVARAVLNVSIILTNLILITTLMTSILG